MNFYTKELRKFNRKRKHSFEYVKSRQNNEFFEDLIGKVDTYRCEKCKFYFRFCALKNCRRIYFHISGEENDEYAHCNNEFLDLKCDEFIIKNILE